MPNTETHTQLHLMVPTVMHKGLKSLADKAGASLSAYAGTLLGAAYAARVKPPTGDHNLDAIVGRVAVLWGEQRNTADIAEALGLNEATVLKIVGAWRATIAEGRVS